MPTVLIIAGPNGAGKTTFANALLARRVEPFEFVNADEIARRMHLPSLDAGTDMLAGRQMLSLLDTLTAERRDIALETTLASRSYARRIGRWRSDGYRVELVYLRLPTVEDSLARVRRRVEMGGHDIPEHDIRRRFPRSLVYLEEIYKPLVDAWQVWLSGEEGLELLDSST
ncbi:AAA family ATPase [Caulobacter endophyticus]|nr:AAA family ATPase [Caulobacter endophyticus]